MSIHEKDGFSNPEELVYLQLDLSKGPAAEVIDGLSHTGDQYTEAIDCLTKKYHRPRGSSWILHKNPDRMKDSGEKEIRRLHNAMIQTLRG